MTQRSRLLLTILTVLAFACAGSATGPPVVHWGVDECSHCHMILSEQRYAAVARSAAGDEVRFDDLGCFARFLAGSSEPWQAWVQDSGGAGWVPADSARYVRHEGLPTPMGSGLTAHATAAAAAAEAAKKGAARAQELSWREVLDAARASAPT
jgi:copper chaperone NosL